MPASAFSSSTRVPCSVRQAVRWGRSSSQRPNSDKWAAAPSSPAGRESHHCSSHQNSTVSGQGLGMLRAAAAARARAYLPQLVLSTALRRNQLDLTLTAPQALAQALTEVRFFHDQAQRPFALPRLTDWRGSEQLLHLDGEEAPWPR